MSRTATGGVVCSSGVWYARISIGKRILIAMPWATNEAEAKERVVLIASHVGQLRKSPMGARVAERVARDTASATTRAQLVEIDAFVKHLIAGAYVEVPATPVPGSTFADVANDWTSGAMAKRFPDDVRVKKSARLDHLRLKKHVFRIIGDVPMAQFTTEHAKRVMAALPTKLSPASRRQVAQAMSRVVRLAVHPLELIKTNPLAEWRKPMIPRGSQPRQAIMFPAEADAVVGCADLPEMVRLFVGFIATEGMRHDEAERLTWTDLDLANGIVQLEENKTNDPRDWPLNPGTVRALETWFMRRGSPEQTDLVFFDGAKRLRMRPSDLRAHMLTAGVSRAELHAGSATTKPHGIHALRGLFVTQSLAAGRSERWVSDRTGHTTSEMISRYQRRSRTWAEAGRMQTHTAPLDVAMGWSESDLNAAPIGSGPTPSTGTLSNDFEGFRRVDSNHDSRIQSPSTTEQGALSGRISGPELSQSPLSAPLDPIQTPLDPIEGALLGLLDLAVKAGDLDAAKRALAELEARRRERSGVVELLSAARGKRGAK